MWQQLIVALLVAGAGYYLVRKFFFAPKTKPGCDKCAKG